MSMNVHECPYPRKRRYALGAWLAPGKTLSKKPEGETWIILFPGLFPGLFLAATALSVNLIGDGLRGLLDPRFAKEV